MPGTYIVAFSTALLADLFILVQYFSPCGLYYKHMTIVNDDSSIISEQSF
jgi:hypothetical protein